MLHDNCKDFLTSFFKTQYNICYNWCRYFVVFWFEIHLYTIAVIFTITLYLNVRKKVKV